MARFPCPYLGSEVELTEERERHIRDHHADADEVLERLAAVLAAPGAVMRDALTGVLLLALWIDFPGAPRHIVSIVVRDDPAMEGAARFWVVTAYSARRLPREGRRWRIA